MACREPTDAAQGPEDGAQRDGGCCAGGRQVLRRTTADGLRGGSPDVVPCVADGLWRVGRWRAEGRRMLRRKQADDAWRVGEFPTESAQGLYLARKSYSPFR